VGEDHLKKKKKGVVTFTGEESWGIGFRVGERKFSSGNTDLGVHLALKRGEPSGTRKREGGGGVTTVVILPYAQRELLVGWGETFQSQGKHPERKRRKHLS